MNLKPKAILALADGTVFHGVSIGIDGECIGELVFNTSMTGYQEILSDPSYAQQIVLFTTSHVGNTGCNQEDMESKQAWANGVVIRDYPHVASNYRADLSLADWLKQQKKVAIAGVDTRALTQRLRDQGAVAACILAGEDCHTKIDYALMQARAFPGLSGMDLAQLVSRQSVETWQEGSGGWRTSLQNQDSFHVIVYDFGVKQSILRQLVDRGCRVTLVPAKTPARQVLAMCPQGIVLSNGPGDPRACDYAIEAIKQFLAHDIPLLGICLGFQLLALACGAQVVKMKFGHHGGNHPVVALDDQNRVLITSQNHGFAVDEASLPDELQITHRSLFDGSLQGILHRSRPAFAFQGHPEANPGPHDADILFDRFIINMRKE